MSLSFVYRSHYLGELSKQAVKLPEKSVLDWFKKHWEPCLKSKDPHAYLTSLLGSSVYGLSSLFEAAKENKLPAPKDLQTLKKYIDKHLYVEGEARLDAHSLRVLTDDDEVQLAYFFFDDDRSEPERVAYLLHDRFPLPIEAASKGSFSSPVPEEPLLPKGKDKGRTWAIFLTFYDSESMPFGPVNVFEGVRVPGLAAHLKATGAEGKKKNDPSANWPSELRLLRAALWDAASPQQALERCACYPLWSLSQAEGVEKSLAGDPADAWLTLQKKAAKQEQRENQLPSLSLASEHLWQITTHQSDFFGYQQWFLFDDLWAAKNPALASSLLRYAHHWDPWSEGDEEAPDSYLSGFRRGESASPPDPLSVFADEGEEQGRGEISVDFCAGSPSPRRWGGGRGERRFPHPSEHRSHSAAQAPVEAVCAGAGIFPDANST